MTNPNDEASSVDGGGFSESWLSLREPADHLARSRQLSDKLVSWCLEKKALNIVELGAGTGSNLRYLMPQLGHQQQWRLIDNDAALLEHLPTILQPWADNLKARLRINDGSLFIEHNTFSAKISTEVIDLANDLDHLSVREVHLLSASALLDLTSEAWLNKLARLAVVNHCACLFVLNYNGAIQWHPELPSDADITQLLNLHQLGDKGFGPASGPSAGQHIAKALENSGRMVEMADSNWLLDKTSGPLQQAIIDGWAPAAREQNGEVIAMINQWHSSRQQFINQAMSTLTVGHTDILSLP